MFNCLFAIAKSDAKEPDEVLSKYVIHLLLITLYLNENKWPYNIN